MVPLPPHLYVYPTTCHFPTEAAEATDNSQAIETDGSVQYPKPLENPRSRLVAELAKGSARLKKVQRDTNDTKPPTSGVLADLMSDIMFAKRAANDMRRHVQNDSETDSDDSGEGVDGW